MDIIFNGMHNNFFKSEQDRNLWIKLNAERIQYTQKVVNNVVNEDLGSIDIPYSSMWVSNNQLEYDESNYDAPRFSLEDLLLLSQEDLLKISKQRNQKLIKELYDNL